jgi:hydrogenase-4 component F
MALLLIIFTPLVAAILSFLAKTKTKFIAAIAIFAGLIELVSGFIIVAEVLRNGIYAATAYFAVDCLGAVMILILSVVGLMASWYSVAYLKTEMGKQIIGLGRFRQYFVLLHLFLMAMFLAIASTSPIVMWIAIEATTLSTAFLISFYNKPTAMEAAWKYLIINSVGLLLGFFGTLLFLVPVISHDLANWHNLLENAGLMDPAIAKIAFIFILVGYGTKMGLAPMHTWLPDAHSKAPVPISSLLSGVLLNVAFFAILRFKLVADAAVGQAFSQNLLIIFGMLSIIIAALIIFVQKNYKRLLAYSSIEHMGIMAMGFGFGGIGIFGAILHMIYHSFAKSLLFLSSGNIFLKYSSTKIANVTGALKVLPISGMIFFIGFLAITGTPPFGLFLTKIYILSAGMSVHPVITVLALLSFALVFAGFLKHVMAMTFGEPEKDIPVGEKGLGTVLPPVILALILLTLSFYIPAPLKSLISSIITTYSPL